jgi:hypothetical protein
MLSKVQRLAIAIVAVMIRLAIAVQAQTIVTEQWTDRLFGPDHHQDEPCAVALDSSGNIYVAGSYFSFATLMDFIVVKYSPDGIILWRSTWDGPGDGYDTAVNMIRDDDGNTYVTGNTRTEAPEASEIYSTVKFNAQGQFQWEAHYDGPGDLGSEANAIALDGEGNVYVTGRSNGLGGYSHDDFATIKYNSQGQQQWVARFDASGSYDCGVDLAVDGQGNVYVAGISIFETGYDYATVKYDVQGVQQWVARYNGPANDADSPCALALDAEANVFVAGSSDSSPGFPAFNDDFAVVKYNSEGLQQWVARYDSPEHFSEDAADMTLDAAGNVLVVGKNNFGIAADIVTVKFDSEGRLLWARNLRKGCSSYADGGSSVTTDAQLNVYVTGELGSLFEGNNDWGNCATVKYDASGAMEWLVNYPEYMGPDEVSSAGKRIALDRAGNVIVSGTFKFDGGIIDYDFLTIKYRQHPGSVAVGMSPTVSPILIPASGGAFTYHLTTINDVRDNLAVDFWWQVNFPGDLPRMIYIDSLPVNLPLGSSARSRAQNVPAGAPAGVYQYIVYIGQYPGLIWASDTLVAEKLPSGAGPRIADWSNTGERPQTAFDPSGLNLCASPNPFNPTTVISYTLPAASFVKLQVFDIDGRNVGARLASPLHDGWQAAGTYKVTFDGSGLAAGVYVCQLAVGEYTANGKIVLLK